MTSVKYENSLGVSLMLNDGQYFVNGEDLRNFSWGYEVLGRPSGFGGTVKGFNRPYEEKPLRVAVRGTREEFLQRMNALQALTEPDVLLKKPGRLWVDGQYITCYIISSELTVYSKTGHFAEKSVKVLAVEPFWNTETTQRFSPSGGGVTAGKKYPLRFPYRYGTGYSNQTLYNTHYAETPIRLVIFGPATNPEVTVAGHPYAVTVELLAGERLEINQLKNTVVKIDVSGEKYDLFDVRAKDQDVFQPVPAGASSVQFTNLTLEITLVQRRSEPLWI